MPKPTKLGKLKLMGVRVTEADKAILTKVAEIDGFDNLSHMIRLVLGAYCHVRLFADHERALRCAIEREYAERGWIPSSANKKPDDLEQMLKDAIGCEGSSLPT